MNIPGGQLCQRFGAKSVLLAALAISATLALITPAVAQYSGAYGVIALTMLRFVLGLSQGSIFPAVNSMLAAWAPLNERARISSIIYCGGPVSIFIQITTMIYCSSLLHFSPQKHHIYVYMTVISDWILFRKFNCQYFAALLSLVNGFLRIWHYWMDICRTICE